MEGDRFDLNNCKTWFKDVTKSALWEVSSNKPGYEISKLFDGDTGTFWQSDSNPPHAIEARFEKKTYIKEVQLFISLDSDESYTPEEVTVYIGDDMKLLTKLKTEKLSKSKGWVPISINTSTIFLRLEVSRNHAAGRDTRVRQIHLIGMPQVLSLDPRNYFHSVEATKYLTIR